MKLSARNNLKGQVKSIEKGAVNALVQIDIGGGQVLTSSITNQAVEELQLAVGQTVYAVIKASHVMVGVDD